MIHRKGSNIIIVISHCVCIASLSAAFLLLDPAHRHRGVWLPSTRSTYSLFHSQRSRPHGHAAHDDVLARPEPAVLSVREIIALLERAYPNHGGDNGHEWTKTRKYLYQYCATAASAKEDASEGRTRSKRRSNRGPLTTSRVHNLLSFLRTTFPNHPEIQAQILRQTPRILGQCDSIESRLIPTVNFLQGLYSGMAEGGDVMFNEAISRNTDLLLVRGVGYQGGGRSNKHSVGEDDNHIILEMEEYFSQLSVSASSITKLKSNHPSVFQLLVPRVKPVVQYLSSFLDNDAPQSKHVKQLAKIVTTHPMLLQLDVATNLEPTSHFLRSSMDMTEQELARVITATPGVLGLSVVRNLKPTIQFLRDVLTCGQTKVNGGDKQGNGHAENMSKTLLRKCILKHPQILALSLSNLRGKRDYFDHIDSSCNLPAKDRDESVQCGKTGRNTSLAARILVGAPSTYSLSLKENIVPKIEYLGRLWGNHAPAASCSEKSGNSSSRLGSNSLSDNLRECPQVLTLSKDGNIIPTLSFYNMTGYVDLNALSTQASPTQHAKCIIRSRYIATSLYNRLLPRWHFLLKEQEKQHHLEQQVEFPTTDATHSKNTTSRPKKYILPTHPGIPSKRAALPPLHLLAGASDAVFCRQLKLSREDYLSFKEEAAPRLKFNSQFDRWLKTGLTVETA